MHKNEALNRKRLVFIEIIFLETDFVHISELYQLILSSNSKDPTKDRKASVLKGTVKEKKSTKVFDVSDKDVFKWNSGMKHQWATSKMF